MPPRARPTEYDRKLARLLTLTDGRALVTLHDAAALLAANFSTVRAWAALEDCIELLMVPATPGRRDDIKAATDQLEIVLRIRQLL